MKLLFLTDNFPPEVNAPASRTFEHCREWVKAGVEVTVITCAPNFPQGIVYKGYRNRLYQKETMEGIQVIRVWTYIAANKDFFKRSVDFMSFFVSSFLAGLFIKTDVIVATSPQFFTAVAGRKLAFWKNKPWIMEVRDLWPESIKNINAFNNDFIIRYLEREEKKCYKYARGIVSVTEGVNRGVISKDIPTQKTIVVTNGSNLDFFKPKEKPVALAEQYNLSNKLVISYIGTHGMAHKLEIILSAAEKLKSSTVHFLLIGDGSEKENLQKMAEKMKLDNVTFIDSVSKDKVVDFLALTDVSLIHLMRSDLFLGAIPSKIFESAAMEKPILLGVDGEARELIEKYGAGLYFEPENEEDLINKINLFLNKEVDLVAMKAGCRKLSLDFDRKILAKKMLDFIAKQIGITQ